MNEQDKGKLEAHLAAEAKNAANKKFEDAEAKMKAVKSDAEMMADLAAELAVTKQSAIELRDLLRDTRNKNEMLYNENNELRTQLHYSELRTARLEGKLEQINEMKPEDFVTVPASRVRVHTNDTAYAYNNGAETNYNNSWWLKK